MSDLGLLPNNSVEVPTHTAFDILITMVSWEERSTKGLERLLERFQVSSAILIQSIEWKHYSDESFQVAIEICRQHGVNSEQLRIPTSHHGEYWDLLRKHLNAELPTGARVLVDLSTMPREVIWTVLFFLDHLGAEVTYAYHRPREYSNEWLSRDPGRPRLMMKMGGETQLGSNTVLVVATGFDPRRTEQLYLALEPELTVLAIQTGNQFDNVAQNELPHTDLYQRLRDRLGSRPDGVNRILTLSIDAYASDHGQRIIEDCIAENFRSSNVIMSSLGPKLSAVALYKINRENPSVGLIYAPSGQYNLKYSTGIEDTIYGFLRNTAN